MRGNAMSIEELPVRWAIVVGLLAIIPATWYGFGRGLSAGIVTVINVIIIIAALYVATEPVAGGHGHGNHADES